MRPNRSHPHRIATTPLGRRSVGTGQPTSRNRLRAQVISDGVIAGYIHDISVRGRRDGRTVTKTRRAGETA